MKEYYFRIEKRKSVRLNARVELQHNRLSVQQQQSRCAAGGKKCRSFSAGAEEIQQIRLGKRLFLSGTDIFAVIMLLTALLFAVVYRIFSNYGGGAGSIHCLIGLNMLLLLALLYTRISLVIAIRLKDGAAYEIPVRGSCTIKSPETGEDQTDIGRLVNELNRWAKENRG